MLQGRTVFFQPVALFQEHQRFSQTSADMFLCQVDGTFVGDTEVNRKLADKEHGQIVILGNQGGDSTHRNQTDNGRFKSSCSGNEVLFRKVGAVRKIFPAV